MHTAMLAGEFTVLFVLLPVLVRLSPVRFNPLLLLWLSAVYCRLVDRNAPAWHWNLLPAQLPSMLTLFAVVGGVIVAGVWRWDRAVFFNLPRQQPRLWLLILLLYPLLSVVPQTYIYRGFLMHRYAPLVEGLGPGGVWVLVAAGTLAFGWMHIVFRSHLAVFLTMLGGGLFLTRYVLSGSLAASALEHTLYGLLMFSSGLGSHFYHAAERVRPAVAATPFAPAADAGQGAAR